MTKFQHNIVVQLLMMSDPVRETATGWKHFKCPFCPDKSAHLGINGDTGAVRCLRCGITGSVRVEGKTAQVAVKPLHVSNYVPLFSTVSCNPKIDDQVRRYLQARGIFTRCGWAYGRDRWAGFIAFPSYGPDGLVRYCQWRYPGKNEGGLRYRNLWRAVPRLDCDWISVNDPQNLILTEGPIDALSVREKMGLSASPVYGVSRKDTLLRDVWTMYKNKYITGVIILFDNDEVGMSMGQILGSHLEILYGVPVKVAKLKKAQDPATATPEELAEVIGRTLK